MVIDKTDKLYNYLSKLNVDDIDEEYLTFAKMGRYSRKDVQIYCIEKFKPSMTSELDEKELEKVLDYYIDIKNVKPVSTQELNNMLIKYKQSLNRDLREQIINSQLRDVMMMCINYKSHNADIDLQDLIQVANISVLTALDKYEPKNKIAFKDYIVFYLNKAINQEFKEINNG